MSASRKTIEHIAQILVAEIGLKKSQDIVTRIHFEVEGNKSFQLTIQKLGNYLNHRMEEPNGPNSSNG